MQRHHGSCCCARCACRVAVALHCCARHWRDAAAPLRPTVLGALPLHHTGRVQCGRIGEQRCARRRCTRWHGPARTCCSAMTAAASGLHCAMVFSGVCLAGLPFSFVRGPFAADSAALAQQPCACRRWMPHAAAHHSTWHSTQYCSGMLAFLGRRLAQPWRPLLGPRLSACLSA